MVRRALALAPVLLGASAAACTLFVAIDDDLTAGSALAKDAGGNDTATTVPPSMEAGSDAGPPGSFCALHLDSDFCDDFSGPTVEQRMVRTSTTGDGGVVDGGLDTADFVSAPSSFHALIRGIPPTQTAGQPGFTLTKEIASLGTERGFRCELSFRFLKAAGDFVFMELYADEWLIFLGPWGISTYFERETKRTELGPLLSTPPAWKRWAIGVDPEPVAGMNRVWVEELSPNPRMLFEKPYAGAGTPIGTLDLVLGPSGYDPQNVELNIDDVRCDLLR